MLKIQVILGFLVQSFSMLLAQEVPVASQVKLAVAAAPAELRDGATVYGHSAKGDLVVIRKGSNDLVCIADDAEQSGLNVSCYHQDLEPFMKRGRELKAQGKSFQEIFDLREREVKEGKLTMPKDPSSLYVFTAAEGQFDKATGEVTKGYPLCDIHSLRYCAKHRLAADAKRSRDALDNGPGHPSCPYHDQSPQGINPSCMKQLLPVLLLFLASLGHSQEPVDSRERQIVLLNVHVIPMDTERVLEDQTVIIKDGTIAGVGKNLAYAQKDLIIDATGKYLIPGLAEMHAHVPPVEDFTPMKEVLMLFAVNGITTIRGMLGHPKHLELRDKINQHEVLGPRFYTTGPSFNGMSVTSPEAGAEMVRKQKEAGYDYLKLHPGLTRAEFDAIAQTADAVKIPFAGHVSFGVGVWRAIEAGYSSIDHLDGFVEGLVPGIDKMVEQQAGLFGMFVADQVDDSKIPALMEALKKNNVWVVPTQSLAERWFSPTFDAESFRDDPHAVYMKKETVEQWITSKKSLQANPKYDAEKIRDFVLLRRRLIKACHDHGVGLLLGCDAPQVFNVPGFSTHHELSYLVASGLTPFQALQTGTVNVAQYLGLPHHGVIRPGATADLILLEGNPLTDIHQTKRIEGVMLNGRWLSKTYITNALKKLEK